MKKNTIIYCTRCKEEITKPVFINGNPYGYTCAVIVSPDTNKPNKKDNFVLADGHNFNETVRDSKKIVLASYNGRTYKDFAYKTMKNGKEFYSSSCFQLSEGNVYINLNRFK